jgi:hypothetical protein
VRGVGGGFGFGHGAGCPPYADGSIVMVAGQGPQVKRIGRLAVSSNYRYG